MPKFFDPNVEYEKKRAAWRRSRDGKKTVKLQEERQKEHAAAFTNPDQSPAKSMVWSKRHGRWVWPDKRGAARKRRDAKIARETGRLKRIWKPVTERIVKGWGPHVACGLGWKDLIFGLTRDIDRVWDGFSGRKGRDCWALYQAKEKFGGLRYYWGEKFRLTRKDSARVKEDAAWRARLTSLLVGEAEEVSFRTCEECNKYGQRRTVDGWICVECDDHYRERLNLRYRERRKSDKQLTIEDLMDEEELRKRKSKRKKA